MSLAHRLWEGPSAGQLLAAAILAGAAIVSGAAIPSARSPSPAGASVGN